MARITVEDCMRNVDNLFDLVMVAAKRARRIANGAEPMVELENDKPTVIALREIAEGLVDRSILEDVEPTPEELLSSEEAEQLLSGGPIGMPENPLSERPMDERPFGDRPPSDDPLL